MSDSYYAVQIQIGRYWVDSAGKKFINWSDDISKDIKKNTDYLPVVDVILDKDYLDRNHRNNVEDSETRAILQQTLDLSKQRIDLLFGKDKEIQEGLGKWFA